MTLTTRTLPACWSSYLLTGDLTGTHSIDRANADAFLSREKLPKPADCADKAREQWQNDAHAIPLGGLVLEFIFLIP